MSMTMPEGDPAFNAALDDCARRLTAGEPLARCLADYPADYHAELARLAPLAARVGQLGVDPAPAFQDQLERRLRSAVAVERHVRRRDRRRPFGRLLAGGPARVAMAALLTVLVLLVGGVGALAAAEDSLPDSPLYQVKTAREATELFIARDDETRVGLLLRQLALRGRELGAAVAANRPRPVVEFLAVRVAETTERIVDRALELHTRRVREPARRALTLVRQLQRPVERAIAQAPPDSQPALRRLNAFLEQQERRLVDRLGASAG